MMEPPHPDDGSSSHHIHNRYNIDLSAFMLNGDPCQTLHTNLSSQMQTKAQLCQGHCHLSHQNSQVRAMNFNSKSQCASFFGNEQSTGLKSIARRVSYKGEDLIKPTSKRVVFNESVTVFPILEKASEMSLAKRNELYYTTADMEMFRSEVKALCVRVIGRARFDATMKDPAMTSEEHICAILASEPSLRGLEKFTSPQRNRNRCTVISAVLKYHRHLSRSSLSSRKQTECLSECYANLSDWSLTNALETARLDSLEAYGHEDIVKPAPASRKRSMAEDLMREYDVETAKAVSSVLAESSKPIAIEPFPKLMKKRKR
jgi:hypothetical protein